VAFAIGLAIAALFIDTYLWQIGRERREYVDEWTVSLVLSAAGVVVNVGWLAAAAVLSRRGLRPLVIYIVLGFVLNCVLVAFASGVPVY
jgi:cytochrome c oxidase assembly factor CtaG